VRKARQAYSQQQLRRFLQRQPRQHTSSEALPCFTIAAVLTVLTAAQNIAAITSLQAAAAVCHSAQQAQCRRVRSKSSPAADHYHTTLCVADYYTLNCQQHSRSGVSRTQNAARMRIHCMSTSSNSPARVRELTYPSSHVQQAAACVGCKAMQRQQQQQLVKAQNVKVQPRGDHEGGVLVLAGGIAYSSIQSQGN
jgi:hypothetical protein